MDEHLSRGNNFSSNAMSRRKVLKFEYFLVFFTYFLQAQLPVVFPYLTSSTTFMFIRQGNKKYHMFCVVEAKVARGAKQKAVLYCNKDSH
jgi:hypothetical protein